METEEINIIVHSHDRAELEDLSALLYADVQEAGGKLEFAAAEGEAGEKGAGIDWNTLLLTLLASGGVAVALVNMISARINQTTSITIKKGKKGVEEISFTGKITERDRKMLEEFLKPAGKK